MTEILTQLRKIHHQDGFGSYSPPHSHLASTAQYVLDIGGVDAVSPASPGESLSPLQLIEELSLICSEV